MSRTPCAERSCHFPGRRRAVIASLSGIVELIASDGVVVDVGGVGYLVFAASRTLAKLPARGKPVKLLIETHVREDHI
ncbi:MAG: OB-fold domain-containing protein, partial [Stellaceae bacterium]